MKIKKLISIILVLFISHTLQAQKVKIKKGIAYVDGNAYVKVEKDSGNMSIYSLDSDDEIIFVKWYDPTPTVTHYSRSSRFNHQPSDAYYIVRFIDFNKEVEISGKTRKGIIRLLFKNKIIKDHKIDKEKMSKFIAKYGSDESKNKLYIKG